MLEKATLQTCRTNGGAIEYSPSAQTCYFHGKPQLLAESPNQVKNGCSYHPRNGQEMVSAQKN
eukprot:3388575-Amphidinium_carterae.2